jgi:metallo-beta-lactamase family protein
VTTLKRFKSIDEEENIGLSPHCSVHFRYNGHIIGSTFIEIDLFGKKLVFSGDVGRLQDDLLDPPKRPQWADYLFVESTYGDREHPEEDLESILRELTQRTIQRRANVLIVEAL